jgi:translation initiation factor IF-3
MREEFPEDTGPLVNEQIRSNKVRLIDENGENVGVVGIREAQNCAKDAGLDLVEVSPNANPPVCKIIDYGKLLYDQKKKNKKNETKNKMEIKEIRFGISIDKHDLEIKAKKARGFIQKGWKVKLQVKFKGRENRTPEMGLELINELVKMVGEDIAKLENEPSRDGRFMNTVMAAR